MMTIVRTEQGAQESVAEVTMALDELAREGARRMILAALQAEVDAYQADLARPGTPAAMRWWFATG